ncbi:MAG: SurA N-terminal domain-containing protein [Bdellovibrionota bacterium]|nr:SurA N-terminal domain-containing protein [Bdellovibrionota bacterium]
MFDILKYPNRRKTITAYIIFGAICLVFVFMGMDYGGNPTGGHAAIVNDKIISPRELETAYNQLSRVYGNMFGGNNPMGGESFLRQMALNQLVNQTLITEYSSQLGVEVSPAELQNFIINIPAFQADGRFRKDYYQNFIKNQNTSMYNFEKQLSRELAYQKVQDIFRLASIPSKIELEREKELLTNVREAKVLKWSENSFSKLGKNADKEISKWLAKNKDKIKEEYEKNPDDYKTDEQVKARHILLKTEDKSASEKQALLKEMQEIKKTLTPENFAEVAKEKSEDPGSARNGGDLGYFGKGQMVPAFEKVAFANGVGQISDIVESDFGYHIILVEDKKPAGMQELSAVEREIAEKLMVESQVNDFEKQLKGAKNFKAIERLAKKYDLKMEETGEINASTEYVKGVGRSTEVLDQVFSMKQGEISDVIESAGEKYLVYISKTDKKENPSTQESLSQRIQAKYSQKLMADWTKEVEKDATIVRNEAYLNR